MALRMVAARNPPQRRQQMKSFWPGPIKCAVTRDMGKVLNRERLVKKLKALPASMRREITPAMEAGATEIVALMKHLAPVLKHRDKRRQAGELRDSIGWKRIEAPQGETILITAGSTNPGGPFYARFVEFGVHEQTAGEVRVSIDKRGRTRRRKSKRTVGYIAPQPFFYPAFRALKKAAGAKITKAARAAIKKTAAIS